MDEVKEVVIKYVSGREELLDNVEAMRRIDWLENRNREIIFERLEPLFRIYKIGDEICFETEQGTVKFANMEELEKNTTYSGYYKVYSKFKPKE